MSEYRPCGVIPVLEVPFHADESVDAAGFVSVVTHTIDAGADAVMFPAFASEFLKLSDQERATLEGTLLGIAGERGFPAIISVQEHATRLAAQAAARAVESGAAALNLLPPHRLGVSAAAMRHHLTEVLAAVDGTPVVLQYAPAETGASLDLRLIAALCERYPNLWGVKVDSSPAGAMIDALAAAGDRIGRRIGTTVGYAGLHVLDCYERGADAVQPGCSFTELYVDLWRLLSAGDTAAAADLHGQLLPYLNHWMQGVELIVAAEKQVSHRRGWIGSATVRQPGVVLDERELARVDRFLDQFSRLHDRRDPGAIAVNGSAGRGA